MNLNVEISDDLGQRPVAAGDDLSRGALEGGIATFCWVSKPATSSTVS